MTSTASLPNTGASGAAELKKLSSKIDQNVPEYLDVHVACDHYGTHKRPTENTWLAKLPRFCVHVTPSCSSWANHEARLGAKVTHALLQRGNHRCREAGRTGILDRVKSSTENAKPLI